MEPTNPSEDPRPSRPALRPARRKRPHPAKRARIATGLLSVAGLVGFTGYLTDQRVARPRPPRPRPWTAAASTPRRRHGDDGNDGNDGHDRDHGHHGDHGGHHRHHRGGQGVDHLVLGEHLEPWQLSGGFGPWAATPT